jgi:hypothetical protein
MAVELSDEEVGLGGLSDSDVGILPPEEPAPVAPTFEPPLGITGGGPIYKSQLGKDVPPPAPSLYEETTPVEEAVSKALEPITTPLHKFTAPARDVVEHAVMLPFQAASDRLEMTPDDVPSPVLEKIVQAAPSDKAIDIATGAGESVADMASFFTSPMGIATLAMGGLPAAAQRAVALGFAYQMGRDVPELATALGDELGKPEEERDYQKIAKLTTDAAQAVGFSALSAAHGLGARSDLPIPRSRQWEGPLQTGAALPPPALRGVPVSLGTDALPGLAERTVADMGGPQGPLPGGPLPVRPSRGPVVPSGGEPIPEPGPAQGPAAPPAAWDDFVTETQRRGRADMTVAEIQSLFPDQKLNREAARRLRDDAFGRPGEAGEVPPVAAPAPTTPPEPPVPVERTPEQVTADAAKPDPEYSPEDWAKYQEIQKRLQAPIDKANMAASFNAKAEAQKEWEALKNKYGGKSPAQLKAPAAHEMAGHSVDDLIAATPEQFLAWQQGGGPQDKIAWGKAKQDLGKNLSPEDAQKLQKHLDDYNKGLATRLEEIGKLRDKAKAETDPEKQKPLMDEWLAAMNKYQQDQIKGNTIQDILHFAPKPEPVTPVAPKAAVKRPNVAARTRFDRETEAHGPDILSWMAEEMPLLSKTHAKRVMSAEKWARNKGDWDDAPDKLAGVHHNVIYARDGFTPDLVAQQAYENHLLSDPTPSALWREIDLASKKRAGNVAGAKREAAWQAEDEAQLIAWQEAQRHGKLKVNADDLNVGDKIIVGGEPLVVESVDPEMEDVVVKGSKRFGRQTIPKGETVNVDAHEPGEDSGLPEGFGDPVPPPGPPTPPKLRPGEKGTGDLLQGPDQPFNLTGEKGTDADRIAAEKAAAEKAKAEADAIAAKQQQQLPGTEQPTVKPTFTPEEQARIDELKQRLRGKIGGVSAGVDPEIFTIGGELAFRYLRAGVRKFSDFAAHMINDLGDQAKDYLLSWYNNARIQLKEIAHELDSEPEAERQWQERYGKRTEGGSEVSGSVGGGGELGRRPGIRISRKELIPEPRKYVDTHSYAKGGNLRLGQEPFILDTEQVRGINLALDRFVKAPIRAAFVLADGTGFGKTAQLLAIADQYRRMGLGKRVLIVTENKQVASIRFGGDARRMGIDPSTYTITTYTSLGKHPSTGWDLVIFDEAHNLKNADAQKSIKAGRLDAKHTVFATATPMDKPTGAAYFLSEVTGKDAAQIAHDLGYQIVEREDPITHEPYESAVLLPTMTWQKVWANIMAHRDAAIRDGGMIRREYPFYGEVSVEPMTMSSERHTEHQAIVKYYDDLIKQVRNPTARRNFAGQKTLELGRWAEQAKIDTAVKMAVEHIKAGGQAIIVAETDKEQSFSQPIADSRPGYRTSKTTGKTKEVWLVDGAITRIQKLLADQGITDIADIHNPAANDIPLQVREFQAGRKRVALATPQSGGTGIDLDDQTGDRPRLMIALSKNMAGDKFEQLVGRVSRKNTKSPAEVVFLDMKGSFGDERRNAILNTKVKTLKAIQGGEELDTAGGFQPGEPARPGAPSPMLDAPVEGTEAKKAQTKPSDLQKLIDQANPDQGMMYSGIPIPGILHAFETVAHDVGEKVAPELRKAWRSFSMQSLPRITHDNQAAGEAGVRYAVSPLVARAKGLQFAKEVTEGAQAKDFDKKFGTGLTEDNLRDLKRVWNERADEAENRHELIDDIREQIADLKDAADDGDPEAVAAIRSARKEIRRLSQLTDEDVIKFRANADAVTTTIGANGSPFATEADYRAFMDHPETQEALRKHITKWENEKDPIYREAADIDPDLELATRGLDYGARVNLKNILRDNATPTTVGPANSSPLVRATATFRRNDPFARAATGQGSYEGSYAEIMANGFGREYPVAKQHEFIRKLVQNGDAKITSKRFEPELEIKGEATKSYPLTIRPWADKILHIRQSLAIEYEDASGLPGQARLGIYTKAADLLTRTSIQGLAEGSTHISNLLSQVFTGLGPTANPMLNALMKATGRSDLLLSLPKVFIYAFSDRKAEMLNLLEIGAAKTHYKGGNFSLAPLINRIDQGVRLYSADVYKKMAAKGLVEDSETGLREFVNQTGQYSKRLQPRWIQYLRTTGLQPFATAMQTFNIQGLRNLSMDPGAKGATRLADVALRIDKAASFMGFAVLVATLNSIVSGSASGPKGTKLGAVGWIGDDGKLHQLDLGAMTGISRGARITGLQGYVEARRLGLPASAAVGSAAQGVANTAISTATGPANRFGFLAMTGKRPSIPATQEAPVVPPMPDDKFNLLKTQAVGNVIEAAKQANPIVDAVWRAKQGKYEEAIIRQATRFMPKTGLPTETIENLPKAVAVGQLKAYEEDLAKQARRYQNGPVRLQFIMGKLEQDGLDPVTKQQTIQRLRRDGVFRY